MTKVLRGPDGLYNSGEDKDGYLTARLGVKVPELHLGTSGSETQVTATAAELNLVDGSVAGTAVASKALVLDANKRATSCDIYAQCTVGSTGTMPNTGIIHLSGTANITIANPQAGADLKIFKTSTSTGGETITLTAGTFDGTNHIATVNGAGDGLHLIGISSARYLIFENIGSVVLSTA